MPKKRYAPEEVIQHLRTVELDTGKGLAVLDACRKLGINVTGVATIAAQISWILFVIGIGLIVIHLVLDRRTPVE